MNEILEILNRKEVIYKRLYIIAIELKQKDNIKFYQKCIVKIEDCIRIINQ